MNKKKKIKFIDIDQLDKEISWSNESKKRIANLTAYFLALQDIRDAKDKSGLNNEEISKIAGISRSQVSNVLNGKRNATLETLIKIASALGKTIKIELV